MSQGDQGRSCSSEQPVLRQLPYRQGVVYGPIISRRLGRSLGINLLGASAKTCSFDCLYCQFPRAQQPSTWKAEIQKQLHGPELLNEIRKHFLLRHERGDEYDSVTFSGNGDASIHPDFVEVARLVHELRSRYFPTAALSIFTNATPAPHEGLREALAPFDNVFLKVDGGDDETIQRINRPQYDVDLGAVVDSLADLPGLTFQTMVSKGLVDNRASVQSEGFLDLVRRGRPREIHLYTVNKLPAYPGMEPLTEAELGTVQDWLQERIEVPVQYYFDDCTSGFPDDPRLAAGA